EIGTGSGYQTAVLSILAKKVYSIEIKETLFKQAKNTLEKLKIKNIELIYGNGSVGYIKKAPYDRIIVTAAAKKIPIKLKEQLKDGGILVIPVGTEYIQILLKIKKIKGKFIEESITPCRFVPLI
ncbi:protein-L-isoaspartate O-methyltransferase, partial [archaeon]|nr:protein-L-isoaspartate O-methyltransferase [archaeon]